LRTAVGIEDSFKAAGVDEAAFIGAIGQQALNAYEDQCAPANPRMPMVADLADLMQHAYFGTRRG
jgi:acetaldehyde dehydrogenase/alcohol dehydrogenase